MLYSSMFIKLLRVGGIGLMLCAATAWAGPASIQGIVKDAQGRYISQGLQPGVYRVSLVVNGAVKASISNTKAKPDQSTVLNFDLKPAATGQASTQQKSGKHMVWIPAETGSHMGGRWVEVDDNAASNAGALNVKRANAEQLQRHMQSM